MIDAHRHVRYAQDPEMPNERPSIQRAVSRLGCRPGRINRVRVSVPDSHPGFRRGQTHRRPVSVPAGGILKCRTNGNASNPPFHALVAVLGGSIASRFPSQVRIQSGFRRGQAHRRPVSVPANLKHPRPAWNSGTTARTLLTRSDPHRCAINRLPRSTWTRSPGHAGVAALVLSAPDSETTDREGEIQPRMEHG